MNENKIGHELITGEPWHKQHMKVVVFLGHITDGSGTTGAGPEMVLPRGREHPLFHSLCVLFLLVTFSIIKHLKSNKRIF